MALLLEGKTEGFGCQIMNYQTSLGQLRILVTTDDGNYELDFSGVRYMQCSTAWNDASFRLNSEDEKITFMTTHPTLKTIPIEAIGELFHLYTIDSLDIKIVASSVSVIEL